MADAPANATPPEAPPADPAVGAPVSPDIDAQVRAAKKRKDRRTWTIIAIAAVLGLGFYVWEEHLENRVLPKRWGVVEEGHVYRAGLIHANLQKPTLEKYGIDVVVSMLGDVTSPEYDEYQHTEAEKKAVAELGIEFHRYPLYGDGTGGPDDWMMYVNAVEQVHLAVQNDQQILVHCASGAQRTGGTFAIYRLLVQGWTSEQVIDEMEDYAWDHDDVAVINYVNEHLEQIAQELVKRGVIDAVPDPLPKLEL